MNAEGNFTALLERLITQRFGPRGKGAFAEAMGVQNPVVSRWLRGAKPKIETLRRMEKVFGCPITELLDSLDPGVQQSGDGRSLSAKQRKALNEGAALNMVPNAIPVRAVPVISWTHAGEAAAYEELPKSWQDQIYTTSRDPKSFALIVEGDSMSPHCLPGDLVVLMPSEEARNGCIVVAKLADDGIILRRYTRLPTGIRLSAYNPVYPAADYPPEAFSWIYPVHSTVRREWS